MSVYMIIEPVEIMNKEKYEKYRNKVPNTIEKYGGQYLAVGEPTLVIGDWKPERVVIIEFESMNKFLSWWDSPEYREIVPLREQSAKVNVILVQGL